MEIRCENCKAKLNIPDQKIPQGQRVIISCPRCKKKVTLDASTPKEENSVLMVDGETSPEVGKGDAEYPSGDRDAPLEFYEEGEKLALVAETDPAQVEMLKQAVEALGYRYVVAENTGEALGKMRFHLFDLVILSDGFDGIELGQSPIRQHLNRLSMSVRRRMFVALIGDTFNTIDHMMAFALSANLVINRKDLDRLTSILKIAISESQKFYKVYMDTLAEIRKA
jgi:CheY-like chemotaxis protein